MANDARTHWLNSPFNAFSHVGCDWAPDRLWKRTEGVTHFSQGFLWLPLIAQQQMFCQQRLKIAGRKRRGLVALGETWRRHNHRRFFSPGFTLIRTWEAFRLQQWHVELESEGKPLEIFFQGFWRSHAEMLSDCNSQRRQCNANPAVNGPSKTSLDLQDKKKMWVS